MSDELQRKVEESARLALEEEKTLRLVNDRTIGQPVQLRPSAEFIVANTQSLKTDEQIKGEHRERILREEQMQREERNAAMSERGAHERERDHGQSPESKAQDASLLDRIKEMSKGVSGLSYNQREIGNNIGRKPGKDDPGIER